MNKKLLIFVGAVFGYITYSQFSAYKSKRKQTYDIQRMWYILKNGKWQPISISNEINAMFNKFLETKKSTFFYGQYKLEFNRQSMWTKWLTYNYIEYKIRYYEI